MNSPMRQSGRAPLDIPNRVAQGATDFRREPRLEINSSDRPKADAMAQLLLGEAEIRFSKDRQGLEACVKGMVSGKVHVACGPSLYNRNGKKIRNLDQAFDGRDISPAFLRHDKGVICLKKHVD